MNTQQLSDEEKYAAYLIGSMSPDQRRQIKKLLLLAGIMNRLRYPEEHVALCLWEAHQLFEQRQGLGIDFCLFLKFGMNNAEQGKERSVSALA